MLHSRLIPMAYRQLLSGLNAKLTKGKCSVVCSSITLKSSPYDVNPFARDQSPDLRCVKPPFIERANKPVRLILQNLQLVDIPAANPPLLVLHLHWPEDTLRASGLCLSLRGSWALSARSSGQSQSSVLTDTSARLPSWTHVHWQLSTTLVITCLSLRHTHAHMYACTHALTHIILPLHTCMHTCKQKHTWSFWLLIHSTSSDIAALFFVFLSFIYYLSFSLSLSFSESLPSVSLLQPKLEIQSANHPWDERFSNCVAGSPGTGGLWTRSGHCDMYGCKNYSSGERPRETETKWMEWNRVSSWKRNIRKINRCKESARETRVGAGASWYVGGSFWVLKSSGSTGMREREQGRRRRRGGQRFWRERERERGTGVEKQQLV